MPTTQEQLDTVISAATGFNNSAGVFQQAGLDAIAAVGGAYATYLANFARDFWLHPTAGADTNPGTLVAPVKTIQEALNRTPPNGVCTVNLQASMTLAATVEVNGKLLILKSDTAGVKRRVDFGTYSFTDGGITYRGLRNFVMRARSALSLRDLYLVMPLDTGFTTQMLTSFSSMFHPVVPRGPTAVDLQDCQINIPGSPFGPMFGSGTWTVNVWNTTTDSQPLKGRVLEGITDTSAGTDPKNVASITTNLALI